jgi:2-oxo-4-hydroxy-4-carboxy--5-ureidoimidazoline (OHCU) decarboxylase
MGIPQADLDAVFERAPGLADRVQGDDADAIIASARDTLRRMSEAERIAVLNAHPRIGADVSSLSGASRREQGGDAGDATRERLRQMNDEYERTFGFRFVVFVHGRSKVEIIPVLEERLAHTRARELVTGLEEFLAIAHDRLLRMQR